MTGASHKLRPPSVISDDEMRYHSNLLQRYDILPDSAILFPKVHRQFPDTCDEGLWFMGEVKLKTKMTIMTNDLVDHNSSLFTLHFSL